MKMKGSSFHILIFRSDIDLGSILGHCGDLVVSSIGRISKKLRECQQTAKLPRLLLISRCRLLREKENAQGGSRRLISQLPQAGAKSIARFLFLLFHVCRLRLQSVTNNVTIFSHLLA